MGSPQAAGEVAVHGRRRPLLAGGLLAGSGLVDVITAYANTMGDPFVVVTRQSAYRVDITGWAWLHVAIGAAVMVAGLLVFTGRRATVRFAIAAAVLAIAADLLLFPYAPIRSVLVVGLNGAAIRLLVRRGAAPPGRQP
ncbi:hypothetical protein GA0070624_2531 [Micromonospora rhizosphaerae]|uniref:DUF7144 domain-containing protein n=1 Tax=Micromonospora rhizosphaerae TaxID=568872 RepID=A0A1C6RYY3_9ACTN|nr:hypothetical protein [Micromonospora rhizosphaerae]SCL22446.1 hypothetical protein GA0070624_2531 [Micromonospora rhizosphaerae]